jgi:hypothetical protein
MASGSAVVKWFFNDQRLTDMKTVAGDDAADTAFDGATASLRIMETPDGTGFKLRVEGIDTSVAGRQFGSHLHVGPCVPGVDLTGGHYQDVEKGPVTPENEVWFDVVPSDNGRATANTFVSFEPVDRLGQGAMSIVIHAGTTGGTRETCLPLAVGDMW